MHGVLTTRVAIVGSGPAGISAAIYAARAMLNPIVIGGPQPGGQLTITTDVENYPGFAETIQGPWLMDQMRRQAENLEVQILDECLVAAELSSRPFRLTLDNGVELLADVLIVATGACAKWLGLESEQRYRGAGVSACATCDGFFHRGRPVAVVGGGNTAVEEALYLANFASNVTLIHRGDSLRADAVLQRRLLANPKIEILWDCEVKEVLGDDSPLAVTGACVRNRKTGAEHIREISGLFIAIGHSPASDVLACQLPTDGAGYLIVEPGRTTTPVKGVFAAGDVADSLYRQAVTAAGMGCMAALDAMRFLTEEEPF